MHLSDTLVLKRVELLPSLVQDIATVVDKAIITASENGIKLPPPKGLPDATEIEQRVLRLDKSMPDEKAVASFYQQSTVLYGRSFHSRSLSTSFTMAQSHYVEAVWGFCLCSC
jgi:hypothetical protein